MKFLTLILSLCGFMLVPQHGAAQLVFTGPQFAVDSGDVVSVSFTVSGYQNIIAAQGTIAFDPLVLEYTNVDNFGLASMSANSFGETLTDTGILSFSWSELDLIGKDLNDGDTVFTLHFDAIGNPGDSSFVALTDTPTVAEFIDGSFNPVAHSAVDGLIQLNPDENLGLSELTPSNDWMIYPNPAVDEIVVSGLPFDGVAEAKWYDLSGVLIKTEELWISNSNGKLTITNLNQGVYRLLLGNERCGFENHLVRKL